MKSKLCFLALLCLFFSVKAQPPHNALSIGDQIPAITITNILNHPTGQAKLTDFKGKLLILDFWATWCSPCIAMFPKTDSLQKVFDGKVQFLPVTYQSEQEVNKLFSKAAKLKNIHPPMVVGDKVLHELFPHKELPHYVWINAEGRVKSITGFQEVNADNIRKMLAEEKPLLVQKRDSEIDYDREVPLLLGNYGIAHSDLRLESLLSGYVEGLQTRFDILRTDNGAITRVTVTNAPLKMLFTLAWSNDKRYFKDNTTLVEVAEPSKITTAETDQEKVKAWMKDNTYCQEIIVPAHLSSKALDFMKENLVQYFPQYQVSVEKRMRPCLVLQRTSPVDKIKTSGKPWESNFGYYETTIVNCPVARLVSYLNQSLQHLPRPVVDNTGYTGYVDVKLDTDMTKVATVRKALQAYDLDLVEKEMEIEILVIRDAKQP